jgi:hypothetical protein
MSALEVGTYAETASLLGLLIHAIEVRERTFRQWFENDKLAIRARQLVNEEGEESGAGG